MMRRWYTSEIYHGLDHGSEIHVNAVRHRGDRAK